MAFKWRGQRNVDARLNLRNSSVPELACASLRLFCAHTGPDQIEQVIGVLAYVVCNI